MRRAVVKLRRALSVQIPYSGIGVEIGTYRGVVGGSVECGAWGFGVVGRRGSLGLLGLGGGLGGDGSGGRGLALLLLLGGWLLLLGRRGRGSVGLNFYVMDGPNNVMQVRLRPAQDEKLFCHDFLS